MLADVRLAFAVAGGSYGWLVLGRILGLLSLQATGPVISPPVGDPSSGLNFMKLKPVMDALEARGALTVLVHPGQHCDPAMSGVFFDELGIRPPDHSLGVGSGSHGEQTGRVTMAFEPLVDELNRTPWWWHSQP